jgi:serine/threonine-protein kinase
MGEVWLAERVDGGLKRPVALKLPYAGVRSAHFAERLRRERDILDGLEHRGIARLYDAGVSADDRPYLALEYIEGSDLIAHCNERRLPVRDRLLLFLRVLEAVQFAHSRLVIHRDLKPSNIMVTSDGEVKLLDFGIAKLMTEGEARETELTQMAGRPLTPTFAAPEQIAGEAVTISSDVFSLGLILFELLSGGRPFPPATQTRAGLEEAILRGEPRKPSSSVQTEEQAIARSTTKSRLQTSLKGDLDAITLKAIQKKPEDRYSTADAFHADLQRFLDGESVWAQPESKLYRTRKFVKRNKLPVLAAVLIFLALAGGLSAALWQASIAKREAQTADTLQQFTEGIFRINSRSNPDPVKAQQTTARQLLDIGSKEAATGLNSAPEAKMRMLAMLASLYQDLGVEDKGVALQRERVATLRKVRAADSSELADALIDLASCMHASHSVNEAQAVLLEAKSILDKQGDVDSPLRARLLSNLAENYTSTDIAKAVELGRESINLYRRFPPSKDYATALFTAAFAFITAGLDAEAEQGMSEAIVLSKHFNGDPNPDLPRYYAYDADAQASLMHYADAEKSLRAAYRYARALGGDADVDTLMTEARLGGFLASTSRYKEGLPYLQAATAQCIKAKGVDDPFYTPQMELQYGEVLDGYGRPEEALHQVAMAVKNRRQHRPGTAYLGQMLRKEAHILTELGRYPEAEQALAEDAEIMRKVHGKMEFNINEQIQLALAQGHTDEAARLAASLSPRPRTAGPLSPGFFRDLWTKAEIALQKGDMAAAISFSEQLSNELRSAQMEAYLKVWRVRALVNAGRGYLRLGDAGRAIAVLQQAVNAEAALFDSKSPELGATEALLGSAYLKMGDRRKAIGFLATARGRLTAHAELGERYRAPLEQLSHSLRVER